MVWLIGTVVGLLGLMAVWAVVTVLLQDVKVIPALLLERRDNSSIPNGVCQISLPTDDGVLIDIWESAPIKRDGFCAPPLLFNHGNGHTNALFWCYQSRFQQLGFHTYGYDYRGVAHSTGWPSERGIETDATAILTMIAERHGVAPSEVIVMGISLGSGPACYLAERFKSRRLLIYTPYLSLPELVRSIPGVGMLAPFVWYKFANQSRLINWFVHPNEPRELIVVHGRNDTVIPFSHGDMIVTELKRHSFHDSAVNNSTVNNSTVAKEVRFIAPLSAAHDQVIEATWEAVATELQRWVKETV